MNADYCGKLNEYLYLHIDYLLQQRCARKNGQRWKQGKLDTVHIILEEMSHPLPPPPPD